MAVRVFVPLDSAAVALGADRVAARLTEAAGARGASVELVRNGSRGMVWLEPLVEVEVDGVRHAYGPVTPADVESLFDANFLAGGAHPLHRGPTEAIPWFQRQTRLVFARCGLTDPLSLADFDRHGGLRALRAAQAMTPADIVAAVTASGLRGRGGAGFPAGIKWQVVADAVSDVKYIVCNADEGDSGTFADRMIMEGDPFLLIESMIIAGLACGARQGFIYLRSEYPVAERILRAALATARNAGLLAAGEPGEAGRGAAPAFSLELFTGAGAYICGEESALLNSLEGRRGEVRARPPLPVAAGLHGRPTLVHNVISLCSVPAILTRGPDYYRGLGVGRSTGTMPVQLAGNVARGGLVELPFGVPLAALANDFGGGTRSGRPLRAVQAGGPLGAYLPLSLLDTPLDYEAMAAIGAGVGHGGLVLFDDSVDLAEQARYAFAFCAAESCGKCTPCRIGAVRGTELMDRIIAGGGGERERGLLDDLCEVMTEGSLCALGGMTPIPVRSALCHFPADFENRPRLAAE